eukprot:CAMPEP_0175877268 /NCGR_PEP_ID=MMETSP0107_2-20121207/40523_1 /TAXON_ID=195067 ORGANISM="Goniomonas pacifica, Strain CCMP1869" /NCGR_SAMPLE_ID=MMETSP0107_2 /ASSEMBLY_ACC=CAM_ASM_000203 /LENGTH=67 /DNA_ID=CAMNT_0017196593 /DNA_START=188 /DNA_END=388 /DNA_ORIENTATION=-
MNRQRYSCVTMKLEPVTVMPCPPRMVEMVGEMLDHTAECLGCAFLSSTVPSRSCLSPRSPPTGAETR